MTRNLKIVALIGAMIISCGGEESSPPNPTDASPPLGGSGGSGGETGGSGGSGEDPDAAAPGDECPDLDGLECPNRNNCTIHAVEGQFCSFNCVNADGSPNFGATEGAENSRRLIDFCGMTL